MTTYRPMTIVGLASVTVLLLSAAPLAQGDGMTPLHLAAERGDHELAVSLLKAGADPAAVTRTGRYTPLHVAAKGGHHLVVRALVDAKADVGALTTTGAAPLHFAAASGSSEAVTILLKHGADVDVREPQWGQTPLMFAAASGRTEAVKVLLAHGADVRAQAKVVDLSARNRQDSAQSRERNARVAAIQKQLAAAKTKATASAGSPPAARAARGRGAEDSGGEPEPLGYADLVGAQGGLTALLLASREGLEDTAFALLDGGADINLVSASDRTSPLLMATINGHFDLAMRLLARGRRDEGERRRRDAAVRRAEHAVGAEGAPPAARALHAAEGRLSRARRGAAEGGSRRERAAHEVALVHEQPRSAERRSVRFHAVLVGGLHARRSGDAAAPEVRGRPEPPHGQGTGALRRGRPGSHRSRSVRSSADSVVSIY